MASQGSQSSGSQAPLTVLDVLQSSTKYLSERGVESARLNAEYLLAHALGKKQRIELYLEFDRPLGPKELDPMRDFIRRRGKGEPLQHQLGSWDFHGREFIVDGRALVPRPETEQLIELLLKLDLPAAPRCLDVGLGSGVIALTLAAEKTDAQVEGVDCSPKALSLALENARKLELSERVTFFEGDLLSPLSGMYDLIVANLPYIPSGEIAGLSREVQHDPITALDGGADGLDLICRCILQAHGKLKPGAWLALEIGDGQSARVVNLLRQAGYANPVSHKDYQGAERFVLATRV